MQQTKQKEQIQINDHNEKRSKEQVHLINRELKQTGRRGR